MELVYLYHSGFAALADDCAVLFDFYEDSKGPLEGFVHEDLLKRPGPLYVLSSHFHADHFSPLVFDFIERKPDIRYIFSKDIYKRRKKWLPLDDIAFLSEGDVYADENLKVKAFGSTDCGVSFYTEFAGLKLFHAGDLNNWHWQDESTPEEARRAQQEYLTALQKLQEEVPELDLAMFPVDPRMGSDYYRGAQQFVAAIHCRCFAPMHFDEAYDKADAFAPIAAAAGAQFLQIKERGQHFFI